MKYHWPLLVLAAWATPTLAQSTSDSGFAGVQSRGAKVMGVDQYTSHHVFEDLPDGGRIVLLRNDLADSVGAAAIQSHLREVAGNFARGDFSAPFLVHARQVPGTEAMARLREAIHYRVSDRQGGGEIRITTSDSTAVTAIHQFLAFQRMDHHAMGHEAMDHQNMP
ncbi:MAG TPA: hypothetical protein VEI47_02180 [Gemmatimonadales bacterium]|nr:hypothetical protein [Gemmatimonadales bacterium]